MDDAMVLYGFSLRTRESYLACVAALAKHYHCSPDQLDAKQIQAYLLHLIQERKLTYATLIRRHALFVFYLAPCWHARRWQSIFRWQKRQAFAPRIIARTNRPADCCSSRLANAHGANDHLRCGAARLG